MSVLEPTGPTTDPETCEHLDPNPDGVEGTDKCTCKHFAYSPTAKWLKHTPAATLPKRMKLQVLDAVGAQMG